MVNVGAVFHHQKGSIALLIFSIAGLFVFTIVINIHIQINYYFIGNNLCLKLLSGEIGTVFVTPSV